MDPKHEGERLKQVSFVQISPQPRAEAQQDTHSLWLLYRDFVRNHGTLLSLLEDTLSRILFWTPQTHHDGQEDSPRWREVLYGLLTLHRMATDMALQDVIPESYGTTVSVDGHAASATSLRVGITVVHNLLPTILQLCRREQRPRIRCLLEQVKFALRLVLLGSYWYQLTCGDNLQSSTGLLMNGGMYWPHEAVGITVEQEQALQQRQAYVGRRTGRTVVKHKSVPKSRSVWMLLVGELLHVYRPLHWAHVEKQRRPSLTDWLSTLGIDMVSLLLLQSSRGHSSSSVLDKTELHRRKFMLLLYVLRSPVFEKYAEPVASRAFKGLGKIPVMGSLLEAYLWDWLLYWKHPFASESG